MQVQRSMQHLLHALMPLWACPIDGQPQLSLPCMWYAFLQLVKHHGFAPITCYFCRLRATCPGVCLP